MKQAYNCFSGLRHISLNALILTQFLMTQNYTITKLYLGNLSYVIDDAKIKDEIINCLLKRFAKDAFNTFSLISVTFIFILFA